MNEYPRHDITETKFLISVPDGAYLRFPDGHYSDDIDGCFIDGCDCLHRCVDEICDAKAVVRVDGEAVSEHGSPIRFVPKNAMEYELVETGYGDFTKEKYFQQEHTIDEINSSMLKQTT
jgi:hypothetical protein